MNNLNKRIKQMVKDERLSNLDIKEVKQKLGDIQLNDLENYMDIYSDNMYLGEYTNTKVEYLLHKIQNEYIQFDKACNLFNAELGKGAERIYIVWVLSNQLFSTVSNPYLDIIMQDELVDYSNILSNLVINRMLNFGDKLTELTVLEKRILIRDAVNKLLSNENLNTALKDALDEAFSSINI